jgi:hypothetical protein
MDTLAAWLQSPWPWYVAGPIIGFMVPLMIWIGNRSFGISSNLRHLCAISQPKSIGVDFFKYDWREQNWSLGPVNANFAPALPRESDGCKARRVGKGHPLPSVATPQTRFLAATRRDEAGQA